MVYCQCLFHVTALEPMSTDLPKIVVAPVEHRIFIVYAKHDSMDVGHCESSARQAPAAKW
jgi:hypothetical protein